MRLWFCGFWRKSMKFMHIIIYELRASTERCWWPGKNVFVILFLAIRECIDEPRGINRGVFCERCRPIKRRTLRKNASRRSARGKSDRAVHNGRKKRYCCKKKKHCCAVFMTQNLNYREQKVWPWRYVADVRINQHMVFRDQVRLRWSLEDIESLLFIFILIVVHSIRLRNL